MNKQTQLHRNRITRTAIASAVALVLAAPIVANAESQFSTVPSGAISASANIDFQITIPKVLFLQVGTGTLLGNNATKDQIQFTVPAANLGDSTVINGTGGDLGTGTVTAKVIGNSGAITFTSSTAGALGNGSGDTISYADIATTVTTLSTATPLAAPALADGAVTSITLTPASGKVVSRDAKWKYTYANTSVAAPGTYGGVNTNNSRVTYTASMP